MLLTITKHQRDDQIALERADGSREAARVSKKGPVPHDAVHFFVERALGLDQGFWGMVANGHTIAALAEYARAMGHPSASRAGAPQPSIVQLLQAERVVECVEAELWAPGGLAQGDDATLREFAGLACAASLVPVPDGLIAAMPDLRRDLGEFAAWWIAAGQGQVAQFCWRTTEKRWQR